MTMPAAPQQVFAQRGIDPSELRWTGRPRAGLLFRRSDVYAILITAFVFAFAVFWELLAATTRNAIPITLGAVFIAVAFYFLFGRFVWDAYQRSKTYYGLTSDRAIITKQGSNSIQSLYLPAVQSLGFQLFADGFGTITFGDPARSLYWYPYALVNWSGGPLVPAFEGISDAQHVYDLCVGAQHAGRDVT